MADFDITIEQSPGLEVEVLEEPTREVRVTLTPESGVSLIEADARYVRTVNNTAPDGAGNVTVETEAGVSDHGALTGLSDDDHTQYHTDARAATWGDARYEPLDSAYTKSESDTRYVNETDHTKAAHDALDIDADTLDGHDTAFFAAAGAAPATHATTHVTGGSDPIANAVASGNAGLLSGSDKAKLDGVASGADATPDASETVKGKIEIATQPEADTGTDTVRAITPATLAGYSGLGGSGGVQVDLYDTAGSFTWTKPTGCAAVNAICFGGGGGGGSGRRGAAGTGRGGGGGGAGGGRSFAWINGSSLGSTVAVTVGAGGAGGATQSTNSTDGSAGTGGGTSRFGASGAAYCQASGGGGGAAGTSAGNASGGVGQSFDMGDFYGQSGASGSVTAAGSSSTISNQGTPGGAGGGAINASNSPANGGAGSPTRYGLAGGTAGSTSGTRNGGSGTTSGAAAQEGASGGGGAGGDAAGTVAGGTGGDGGNYGAGAGGGGGSTNGANSGAGGSGAKGCVLLISHLS